MDVFSQRLINLRKERRLTQGEMAKNMNVVLSTYGGWEREDKEPSFSTVCRIARFFNVSTDYLLGVSNERNFYAEEFFNDDERFRSKYAKLPSMVKSEIMSLFSSLYILIDPDMSLQDGSRIKIYTELIDELCARRIDIRKFMAASPANDPSVFMDLISRQNDLKAAITSIIDNLLKKDAEINLNLQSQEASKAAS